MASSGVVFPVSSGTGRSTSALGRAVVADALREIDPIGARAAEHETNWRADYLVHFRRLVEAGLADGGAARRSAAAGLASLHDRMRVVYADGEVGLRDAFARAPEPGERLDTVTVTGDGEVERELSVPYRGERLRGDALARRLDAWVTAGVIEPGCAEAVRAVLANPDWLDLSDVRVVALGAGAEMGPTHSLLRWGGDVVAVDLPRPGLWRNLLQTASRYGGRLHVPVAAAKQNRADLAEVAGADLLHDLPVVAEWLLGVEGRLAVGNYVYADGATNLRVCTAVDALTEHLRASRPDTALAFLATPTDVFAVPAEAVAHADAKYREAGGVLRTLRGPLRMVSAGRLLRRNYPPDADPGVCDSLVAQQGPNYALAKRLQRWRAATAREQGATVSFTVAPPTRTRSVVKNRVLAAAYAGAPAFGVEVFDPAASNTLMAALLVHDLRNPPPVREHVWQEEAAGAAHGGLWTMPYAPRSALGLAALLGFGGARN
ncbi:hypothetical protein [Catellatospora bangladeshensis]|uniref:Uncharacterized protein n=1 Tax=Catellatospora bangladeshensis TaxID=310355 RepID=A0A8J3NI91_9ACTN|nr:hypothetical protein [Catellatospora bangladeshensis]GIF82210.1 hypothetical protein Cba03nite_35590 [Catellatospora bangladeshensis]